MAEKIAACTKGPRHQWAWSKNFIEQHVSYRANGESCRIQKRGLYRCECGETKSGQPQAVVAKAQP